MLKPCITTGLFYVQLFATLQLYTCGMEAALADFIRTPNWHTGARALEMYKDKIPAFELKLIEQHKNEITLDLLYDALKPLNDKQPEPLEAPSPKPKKEKKPKFKARHTYTLPNTDGWPTDLQELKQSVIRWLREQQSIKGALKHLFYDTAEPDGKKGYLYCTRMVKLEAMLQDAYERLDYYNTHKKHLPGTEPMSKEQRLKYLLKRQVSAYEYIKRHKNNESPTVQKSLQERRAILEEIKILTNE